MIDRAILSKSYVGNFNKDKNSIFWANIYRLKTRTSKTVSVNNFGTNRVPWWKLKDNRKSYLTIWAVGSRLPGLRRTLGEPKMGIGSRVCMHSRQSAQTALPVNSGCIGILSWRNNYLFPFELNLEIFSRFLSDASAEIELVDLRIFVPHRRFVVHD